MRALFTQFSVLIGLVTAVELYGRQPNLFIAVLLGISAACTVYIVLLLGDSAVNSYLEDRSAVRASLTYLETGYDPSTAETAVDADEMPVPFEEPDAIAA